MTQRFQQIAQQLSASGSQCDSQECLLAGQVVIVTGGAQGIGEAVVTLFAQHGAKVAISDIDAKRSQRLVEKLEKDGIDAAYFPGDLLGLSFPQTLVQEVLKRFDHFMDQAMLNEPKSIINMSSSSGVHGQLGQQINYVAAKAGVVGMTKATVLEWARYNVRCNAVL
ncbi:hypothetical protein PV11_05510 [Exophiala sideris]|uniref:Uncharacterized protein n=1 Tax=Exophiala sideris TaxID=1016849 RepID=A0A0D1YQB3_9EURO|nr:hypothetical protein PV11_05510 [Exophiala sideris]